MSLDNITVAVRARPLLTSESKFIPWVIENNSIQQIDEDKVLIGETYVYDEIFDVNKKNEDIYNTTIAPMVRSAIEGINLTVFAYGATSSGKTYTMNGTRRDPGVMPRIIEDIFNQIQMCNQRKFLLRVSYVEIYSEVINDLLDKNNKDLKIREDFNNCVNYNPTEKIIKNSEECLNIMKMGTANRTTGETQMNISSSRSHSIFRIVIESTINSDDVDNPVQVSHLNLIDLAGSERVSQTGATGQRFKEGAHINKSLTVLGLVIRQLVDKKDHISYRDSKLTRILSNSLGGNAKTIIICNINMESIEDTISTLMFAQRAKAIKNKPKVNEILTETSLTKKYARECSEINKLLKTELEKNKQLEDEREMSSKKITDLCNRIQSLEEMFVRKGVVKKLPKRRHTFCATLNTISEERDTESLRGLEDFTCDSSRFTLEDDSVILIDTGQSNNSNLGTLETSRFRLPEDTPEKNLRQRLICTTREYEELLEFLRLEEANKLSVEKEMTSKIKDLTEECKDLRIYRERVKTENRKLTQEVEQMKNDYDFIIETQKKKFEKREKELIEELNRSSKKTPTFQVSTFEFEELTEKIQSLEKQNEELHKTIEKLKSQNEKLNMACESFELENEDLNSKISSLEEKHVQSQIENKALETKCSDLESKIVLVESKYDTTLVDPLKKEISELQSNILKIQSELTEVQKELFDSQDKLIQTVQDLDLEEKKSLKLKQELDEEKKLREETERKLEESKQSPHLFRRFSSDSSINQQCKSLDGEVLQMLHKLKYILEMKPKQNEPAISSEAKSSEEITKTDECLDSTYPHETSEDMLDVDLEKIESFSTDYFQDCDKSERYMDFISSFISQRSYLSIQEATGETDNNKSNKPETDLSHELAQLKIEISQLKKEQECDKTTIMQLQEQLKDHSNKNLSDSEKIGKTNMKSYKNINGEDDDKEKNTIHELSKTSSMAEEKIHLNQLIIENKKLQYQIETFKKEILCQKNQINDQTQIITELEKELDAKKYLRISLEEQDEIISPLESNCLSESIDSLRSQLESQREELESQREIVLKFTKEKNEKCSFINEELKHKNNLLEVENRTLSDKIEDLRKEHTNLITSITDENIKLKEKHKLLEDIEEEKQDLQKKIKEIELLLHQEKETSRNLELNFNKQQQEIEILKIGKTNFSHEIEKLLMEKQQLQNEILKKEREYAATVTELNTLKNEIISNKNLFEQQKEKLKIFEKEIDHLNSELINFEQLKIEIIQTKDMLHASQEKISRLSLEIQKHEVEKAQFHQNLKVNLEELELSKIKMNEATKKLEEIQDENSKLSFNLQEFEKQKADYIKENQMIHAREIEHVNNKLKDFEQLKLEIIETKRMLTASQNENSRILQEIEKLEVDKAELREKLKVSVEDSEQLKVKMNETKKRLEEIQNDNSSLTQKLQSVEKQKENSLEQLKEELSHSKQLIENLSTTNKLLEKSQEEKSQLIKKIEEFEREKIETLACSGKQQLDYAQLNIDANTTKKNLKDSEENNLNLLYQIQKLEDENTNILADLRKQSLRSAKLENKIRKYEKSLQVSRVEYEILKEKNEVMHIEKADVLKYLFSENPEAKDIKKINQTMLEEVKDFITIFKCELKDKERKLQALQVNNEELERKKDDLETTIRNLDNKLQEQTTIIKSQKLKIGNFENNLGVMENIIEKEEQIRDLKSKLENIIEENNNNMILIQKIKMEKSELKEILKKTNNRIEEENNNNMILIQKMKTENTELKEILKKTDNSIEEANMKKNNADMKKLLAEKESQIFKLISELESEKTTCLKQIQNIADLMNEKKLLNHHIEVMNKELSRLNKMNNPRINSNGMLITLMNHISELEHLLANENINLHEFQNLILKCKGKAKEESMDIAVEKLKFWVNQVSLLVQERDVLKKENEVEYKNIKQLNKKLEIELSMKTAQHKFLCSDHEVLEETHETLKKNYKKVTDQNEIYKNEVENLKTKLSKLLMEHEGTKQKLENLTFEHQNLSKELYNLEKKRHQEREALKAKENMKENSPLVSENRNYYETVKTKDIESSRSKRSHHLSHEENPEMEVLGKKEDKWKQQRTRAYDSRRSIDLNTICSESTVETCRDCESMKHQLQKMKSEISQIKKDESARSSDLETLKVKYEKLKQLCRIRYEEIQTLQSQQAHSRV